MIYEITMDCRIKNKDYKKWDVVSIDEIWEYFPSVMKPIDSWKAPKKAEPVKAEPKEETPVKADEEPEEEAEAEEKEAEEEVKAPKKASKKK